ncbi:MAG: DUF7594 domain-containing protein, partial [Solirubrobacteraceae bacterium]
MRALVAAASLLTAFALPAGAEAAGELMLFRADADARVQQARPSTNYGSGSLRVDGGGDPPIESYLRFRVSGLSGPVASARLRLWSTSGTVDGLTAHAVTGPWEESTVTWSSRPARETAVLADLGTVATGSVVELDLSSHVTGNGTYDFALMPQSSDGANFSSREASSTPAPELIVELAGAGAPPPAPPPP